MKKLHLILPFIFLIILTGCKDFDTDVVKVDFTKTTKDINSENKNDTITPLRVAVAAIISPNETFSYYQELFDYISKKIKKPILF